MPYAQLAPWDLNSIYILSSCPAVSEINDFREFFHIFKEKFPLLKVKHNPVNMHLYYYFSFSVGLLSIFDEELGKIKLIQIFINKTGLDCMVDQCHMYVVSNAETQNLGPCF